MKSLDRRPAGIILGWAIFFLIFVNAISWSIGWGPRRDVARHPSSNQPGREIERRFGWPANFYCDLWQSDDLREVSIGRFLPPYPIGPGTMHFVYCEVSFAALLLDLTFIACGTALVWIWALAKTHGVENWMKPTAAALVVAIILMVLVGDDWFRAYL